MAVFVSAAMSLRKQLILHALETHKAFSPETALTLKEAGLERPDLFPEYTRQLVDLEIIHSTKDGRFWISR